MDTLTRRFLDFGLHARAVLTLVGISAVAVLTLGCQGSGGDSGTGDLSSSMALNSEGNAASQEMAPLTIAELQERLDLTPSQLEAMEDVLNRFNAAIQSRREQRQQGSPDRPRRGHRGDERHEEKGEPPLHGLLEESARILTPDQFAELVGVLNEHRQSHRESQRGMGHEFGGRFGRGLISLLMEEFDLTEEQQAQIQEAFETQREAMQALHSQHSQDGGDREATRRALRELHGDLMNQLSEILGPEDFSRFKELTNAHRKQRREGHGADRDLGHQRHIEFLSGVLSLSESQRSQLEALMSALQQRRQSLHDPHGDDWVPDEDALSEMSRIRQETEMAIRGLLSADQVILFDALQTLHSRGGHRRHHP
jgi:Spy/CpxP family protein refolding chaperone